MGCDQPWFWLLCAWELPGVASYRELRVTVSCGRHVRRILSRPVILFDSACSDLISKGGGLLFRPGVPITSMAFGLPACQSRWHISIVVDLCVMNVSSTLAPPPCRKNARAPQATATVSVAALLSLVRNLLACSLVASVFAVRFDFSRTSHISGHRHLQKLARSHASRLSLGPAPHGRARWKASPCCRHLAVS